MALASTTDAGQLVVYTEDNNTGFPLGADDVARSPVLTTCKTGTISVPFPSRAVASWLTGSPGVDTSPPDLVDVVKVRSHAAVTCLLNLCAIGTLPLRTAKHLVLRLCAAPGPGTATGAPGCGETLRSELSTWF